MTDGWCHPGCGRFVLELVKLGPEEVGPGALEHRSVLVDVLLPDERA